MAKNKRETKKMILLSLEPQHKEIIKEAAKACGVSLLGYLRLAALEKAKRDLQNDGEKYAR